MIAKTYLFLLMVCLCTACNGQKKMAIKQNMESANYITLIDQNNYSGADVTETMIITDNKGLKLFYAKVNRTRKPGLPVPIIDFSNEIVVIHCSADENYKSTNQLRVLKETEKELLIGMEESSKAALANSSLNTDIMVSPFFVYKMPKTNKKTILM